MSRRPAGHRSRRHGDGGRGGSLFALYPKSCSSPCLPIAFVAVGTLLVLAYTYRGSGGFGGRQAFSRVEGDFSSTVEVQRAIPILKNAYGDSMHKVLHVGPDSCSVVSKLLKEEETEAWGVEPYDVEDADRSCKALVRKGIVRMADIKFPLPYRPQSFSLVIVSDALDYLSPRYLNKTLPDLARVSSTGLVLFTGLPGQHRPKVSEVSKFGRAAAETEKVAAVRASEHHARHIAAKLRSSSWWVRYFLQTSLEENEAARKKFEQAASKMSYNPSCQIFHLKSYQ